MRYWKSECINITVADAENQKEGCTQSTCANEILRLVEQWKGVQGGSVLRVQCKLELLLLRLVDRLI